MTEGQAITTGELWVDALAADELVDHLALGDLDIAERHGEAELFRLQPDLQFADADLPGERMVTAIAALGGVAQCQEKTLVATGQRLQALGAIGGKVQRLAGDIRHLASALLFPPQQAFVSEEIQHPRAGRQLGSGIDLRPGVFALGQQGEVEQAVAVVEGRAKQLAAGQVLEGRRDTPAQLHPRGLQRQRGAEARQRGAVGAQQEDRLHQVAGRLLDRQGSQLLVVQRAFAHHPGHGQGHLLAHLLDAQFGDARVATALLGQ
ncbi:hypothetical protein D9M68_719590 [compost metagenome]